jgi:hypothetical protein
MLNTFSNILEIIFSNWLNRAVVKINVTHLEYNLYHDSPESAFVLITPYPSKYYTKIEFSHKGKTTTIKNLILTINASLKLEAKSFHAFKLESGDCREEVTVFPVEENLAIDKGMFEIKVISTFDKVICKYKGSFPILNN